MNNFRILTVLAIAAVLTGCLTESKAKSFEDYIALDASGEEIECNELIKKETDVKNKNNENVAVIEVNGAHTFNQCREQIDTAKLKLCEDYVSGSLEYITDIENIGKFRGLFRVRTIEFCEESIRELVKETLKNDDEFLVTENKVISLSEYRKSIPAREIKSISEVSLDLYRAFWTVSIETDSMIYHIRFLNEEGANNGRKRLLSSI
jgi:hypothetical protein